MAEMAGSFFSPNLVAIAFALSIGMFPFKPELSRISSATLAIVGITKDIA